MKIGELYTIAKATYPGMNKRLFTRFYNQALENLSSTIRISVKDETFTDDTFQTLPSKLVRIESVESDERHWWSIENGELIFKDSSGEEVDTVDGLKIRYWERIIDAIEEPNANGSVTSDYVELIGLFGTRTTITPYSSAVPIDVVLVDAMSYQTVASPATYVTLPVGTILRILCASMASPLVGNISDISVVDPVTLGVSSDIKSFVTKVTSGSYAAFAFEDLWEEQDDGFSMEAQMAATYFAMWNAGSILGASPETDGFSKAKANHWQKLARLKHNTTPHVYGAFKQVSF